MGARATAGHRPVPPRLTRFKLTVHAVTIAQYSEDSRWAPEQASPATSLSLNRCRRPATAQPAAAHPEKGFACELSRLRPPEQMPEAEYDPLGFLITRTHSGYKFALGNCHADASEVIGHYQATAVPTVPGATGFKAFCTDESGILWYDASGSATACLTSRHSLD